MFTMILTLTLQCHLLTIGIFAANAGSYSNGGKPARQSHNRNGSRVRFGPVQNLDGPDKVFKENADPRPSVLKLRLPGNYDVVEQPFSSFIDTFYHINVPEGSEAAQTESIQKVKLEFEGWKKHNSPCPPCADAKFLSEHENVYVCLYRNDNLRTLDRDLTNSVNQNADRSKKNVHVIFDENENRYYACVPKSIDPEEASPELQPESGGDLDDLEDAFGQAETQAANAENQDSQPRKALVDQLRETMRKKMANYKQESEREEVKIVGSEFDRRHSVISALSNAPNNPQQTPRNDGGRVIPELPENLPDIPEHPERTKANVSADSGMNRSDAPPNSLDGEWSQNSCAGTDLRYSPPTSIELEPLRQNIAAFVDSVHENEHVHIDSAPLPELEIVLRDQEPPTREPSVDCYVSEVVEHDYIEHAPRETETPLASGEQYHVIHMGEPSDPAPVTVTDSVPDREDRFKRWWRDPFLLYHLASDKHRELPEPSTGQTKESTTTETVPKESDAKTPGVDNTVSSTVTVSSGSPSHLEMVSTVPKFDAAKHSSDTRTTDTGRTISKPDNGLNLEFLAWRPDSNPHSVTPAHVAAPEPAMSLADRNRIRMAMGGGRRLLRLQAAEKRSIGTQRFTIGRNWT